MIHTLRHLPHKVYRRLFREPKPVETIDDIVSAVLMWERFGSFKFVEIGVFKGDNAVSVVRSAQRFKTDVFYVGFDLFEDKDDFFKSHPEDLAMYEMEEYPYWEFHSGQHSLANVKSKIGSILPESNYDPIPGDSTQTVPAHMDRICDATLLYIDGCHDYETVFEDWRNAARVIESNPDAIIAFDDLLYPGVSRLKAEIEKTNGHYDLLSLNENQFFVLFKESRWGGGSGS